MFFFCVRFAKVCDYVRRGILFYCLSELISGENKRTIGRPKVNALIHQLIIDDDCFYYFQKQFSTLLGGSMKFKFMRI